MVTVVQAGDEVIVTVNCSNVVPSYSYPIAISGVVVVFIASLLGFLFPYYFSTKTRHPAYRVGLAACTFAATAVLITVAFVHILGDATSFLSNPCLPQSFVDAYPGWAPMICAVAVMVSLLLDYYMHMYVDWVKRKIAKQAAADDVEGGGGGRGGSADVLPGDMVKCGTCGSLQKLASEASLKDRSGWRPAAATGGAAAARGAATATTTADGTLAIVSAADVAAAGTGATAVVVDSVTLAVVPANGGTNGGAAGLATTSSSAASAASGGGGGGGGSLWDLDDDCDSWDASSGGGGSLRNDVRMKRAIFLFVELSVLSHSVPVGLDLGINPSIGLFVAIVFHQVLEGLSVGAACVEAGYPLAHTCVFALLFALTTPLGIALGIGLHASLNVNSSAYLITVGFINAIAAGLLVFLSLAHMNAFVLRGGWLRRQSWLVQLICLGSFCTFGAVMIVIGLWA